MGYSDIRPHGPHLPDGYEARRPIFDVRGWSCTRDQIKRAVKDFQFQSVAVRHLPFIADIVDETCLVAEDAVERSPVAELAPAVRLVLHIWSILQLVSSNKEANLDLIAHCAALISVIRKAEMTRHPGIMGALADPIEELIWVLTRIRGLFEEHLSSSRFTRYVKRGALKSEVGRCEGRIGHVQQLCLWELIILRGASQNIRPQINANSLSKIVTHGVTVDQAISILAQTHHLLRTFHVQLSEVDQTPARTDNQVVATTLRHLEVRLCANDQGSIFDRLSLPSLEVLRITGTPDRPPLPDLLFHVSQMFSLSTNLRDPQATLRELALIDVLPLKTALKQFISEHRDLEQISVWSEPWQGRNDQFSNRTIGDSILQILGGESGILHKLRILHISPVTGGDSLVRPLKNSATLDFRHKRLSDFGSG